MSAFQQSHHHIEAVVGSAVHYGFVDAHGAVDLARSLARHNAMSVGYLYRECGTATPVSVTMAGIIAWDTMPLALPELRVAADGLEYQCCEHPEWRERDCFPAEWLASIAARIPKPAGYSTPGWSISVPAEQWGD